MNKYKEIQLKIYDWTGNWTKDPCITSQVLYLWAIQVDIQGPSSPNYHIPPPLQSLRPRRLARQTHVHPVRTIKCICLNREGQGTKCCNEEWTNTKKIQKWKYMVVPGIEPGTPASLVRCSTTELSRPISTVHLARTTTFLPLAKSSPSKYSGVSLKVW